jgi:hypothetical protein
MHAYHINNVLTQFFAYLVKLLFADFPQIGGILYLAQ